MPGLRLTLEEALARKFITQEQARQLFPAAKQRPGSNNVENGQPSQIQNDKEKNLQLKLYNALVTAFGPNEVAWEYKGAVPGRKFRIDVALPKHHIAVELDGFKYHRSLTAFKADRKRQYLMVVHRWRVLRYFADQIHNSIEEVVEEVARAIAAHAVDDGQSQEKISHEQK